MTEAILSEIKWAHVDAIEISPLRGLDEWGEQVEFYAMAKDLEITEPNDPKTIAWGVYIHTKGEGATSLFDTVDQENAIAAKILIEFLLKL